MVGLDGMKARLRSKRFGDTTLYFDGDSRCVKIITTNDTDTFVVKKRDGENDNVCFLRTETNEKKAHIESRILLHNTWVIPEINVLGRISEVEDRPQRDDVSARFPSIVFEVTDYSVLDHKMYNGSNFSNQMVRIEVRNDQGSRYHVMFLLGDNVRGGDTIYDGQIIGQAFKLVPIAYEKRNGKIVFI